MRTCGKRSTELLPATPCSGKVTGPFRALYRPTGRRANGVPFSFITSIARCVSLRPRFFRRRPKNDVLRNFRAQQKSVFGRVARRAAFRCPLPAGGIVIDQLKSGVVAPRPHFAAGQDSIGTSDGFPTFPQLSRGETISRRCREFPSAGGRAERPSSFKDSITIKRENCKIGKLCGMDAHMFCRFCNSITPPSRPLRERRGQP